MQLSINKNNFLQIILIFRWIKLGMTQDLDGFGVRGASIKLVECLVKNGVGSGDGGEEGHAGLEFGVIRAAEDVVR